MRIFDVPEAKHYCRGFRGSGGLAAGSLTRYVAAHLRGGMVVREGTAQFDEYRDCALREVDRWMFLAIGNHRRSLDLMMPGSANWAQVTLYYSAYFSARAILGMFGGWVGRWAVEVNGGRPGSQELIVNTKPPTTRTGSHERFWDLFYQAAAGLEVWVDPRVRFALTPVAGAVEWQTQTRNEVNYDSFVAVALMQTFQRTFDGRKFRSTLPGSLQTQFSVSEGLLNVVAKFARELRISSDALNGLRPWGTRRRKIERLILEGSVPRLARRVAWKRLVT